MLEYKSMNLENVSVEGRTITGYASVFGGNDFYGDTITKGAFSNAVLAFKSGTAPKMFFNHSWRDVPIGKWTALEEDEVGLKVQGEFTEGNPTADQVLNAIKHETVDGLSIGFVLDDDGYTWKQDGSGRVITDIKELREISVVTFPADSNARIKEVKSIEEIKTVRDYEAFLRDVGASQKEAKALCAVAKSLFSTQRDSDADSKARNQAIEEKLKQILNECKSLSEVQSK